MGKKILFETQVDPGGFDRGIKLIEAKAEASNGRMNRTVYEAQKQVGEFNKKQIDARAEYQERMARKTAGRVAYEARQAAQAAAMPTDTIPGMSGGGFVTGSGLHQFTKRDRMNAAGMGSAASMFMSVARDSAASAASGAPASQIIAQQLPQLLQANAMMAQMNGRTGEIASKILKWGLGLGAAAAALYGIHKLSQGVANVWADAGRGLEGSNRGLERVGKQLRKLREEQAVDNAKAAAKAEADAKLVEDTVQTNDALGTTKAMIREARAADDRARQQMIVDRLRLDEARAARQAGESAPYEFIQGRPDLRKKALDDQLAQAKATLDRVQAEKQLQDLGQKTKVGLSISSDSLTSVGNFLGAGRGMVESIAQQQLSEAKTANRHHETANRTLAKIVEKLPAAGESGIEVPGN